MQALNRLVETLEAMGVVGAEAKQAGAGHSCAARPIIIYFARFWEIASVSAPIGCLADRRCNKRQNAKKTPIPHKNGRNNKCR